MKSFATWHTDMTHEINMQVKSDRHRQQASQPAFHCTHVAHSPLRVNTKKDVECFLPNHSFIVHYVHPTAYVLRDVKICFTL